MAGIKSMSSHAKKRIDDIMSDGEARTASHIFDELYKRMTHSANRYIPTKGELKNYMNRNYSSEIVRERHPLSLNDMTRKIRVTYYWKEDS
jgi:hypothetical protein